MKCPYCMTEQSNMSTNKPERRAIYRDYGSAYDKSNASQGHSYSWGNCCKCGVGLVLSDTNQEILGFNNPRIEYNEPNSHFGVVRERLNRILKGKSVVISGKSQKDLSLIKYLQDSLDTQTSKQVRSSEEINVLVARRYMEHITGRNSVADVLVNDLRPGDILIVEILSFEDMHKKGNLSFLWDERISYPTIQFIEEYFCSQGMNCHEVIRIDSDNEPFSLFILIKQSLPAQVNLEAKGIELGLLRESLSDLVMTRLGHKKNIAFYGINNKVTTILDIILRNGYSADQIRLYDGSKAKIGSRWEGLYVKDFAEYCAVSDMHVFSFNNESSEMIIRDIHKKRKDAIVFYTDSIFKP